jgi:hypothetical protein
VNTEEGVVFTRLDELLEEAEERQRRRVYPGP